MFNKNQTKDKKNDSPGVAGKDPHAQIEEKVKERMSRIKRKILVLSGKGGVGKSTVSVNLAAALASRGYRTGLLDTDLHGPSIPTLLGLTGSALTADNDGNIFPIQYGENLSVISIGFMLQGGDEPVVWRGPLKYSAIRQFLGETLWKDLDYLVIDSPPGTGDEPLSVCQLIPGPRGAVIVTTPQDVALADVRRSITFCVKLEMPIYGVVENMSGMICPHCGKGIDVFKSGGGAAMASEMGVPFLGSIPLHPEVTRLGDEGKPFVYAENVDTAKKPFMEITEAIINTEVHK